MINESQYQLLLQIDGIEDDLPTRPEFLPFKKAREFARSLGIKNFDLWWKYCKSGNKPDNIPADPRRVYKNSGWISMGDWLGTGNVHKKEFLPFEEAKEFARSLNLKTQTEWKKYSKSNKRPNNIPSQPWVIYKDTGWNGWGDWLGTKYIAPQNRKHLPFEEAREFARSLNLTSSIEWKKYCKSGNKPDNIPYDPRRVYKDFGWEGYGDWLGTKYIAHKNRVFWPFEEAREFVHSLYLQSMKEWKQYSKSGKRPNNIPSNPYKTYKDSGWNGYGDWLGTGNVRKKEFLSFEETREFVHSLNFKSKTEWCEYSKSGNKPDNIPASPSQTYKNSGWINWADWLGKQ